MLLSVTHEAAHVLFIARQYDAGGLDLEDAGIGAVEQTCDVVEKDFAFEEAKQVVLKPAQIHGAPLTTSRRGRLARGVCFHLFLANPFLAIALDDSDLEGMMSV